MSLEIGYNKGKDDKIPAVSHPCIPLTGDSKYNLIRPQAK